MGGFFRPFILVAGCALRWVGLFTVLVFSFHNAPPPCGWFFSIVSLLQGGLFTVLLFLIHSFLWVFVGGVSGMYTAVRFLLQSASPSELDPDQYGYSAQREDQRCQERRRRDASGGGIRALQVRNANRFYLDAYKL